MKAVFVNTDLKNVRIYYDDALFRNDELKNTVFSKFSNWIWVMYYWFDTAWFNTLDKGSIM